MLNISADMMYLQDTCAIVRVRAPLNLSVDTTVTTSSWRVSRSNFMSGTLACKPTRNLFEYDEYVKQLFDIIKENCYLTYVK